jgi:hypothetical protein
MVGRKRMSRYVVPRGVSIASCEVARLLIYHNIPYVLWALYLTSCRVATDTDTDTFLVR